MIKNNITRFVKFVFKQNKSKIILVSILCVLSAGMDLYIPLVTKVIVDDGILVKNMNILFKYSIFLSLLTVFSLTFDLIMGYLYSLIRNSVSVKLRLKLLNHISYLSGKYYTQKKTGELLSNVISDVDRVKSLDAEFILKLLKNFVMACVSLFFMFSLNSNLMLYVFVFQILSILLQVFFSKQIYEVVSVFRYKYGKEVNIIQEYIVNIANIVITKSKRMFIHKYVCNSRDVIKSDIKTDLLVSLNLTIASLINLATDLLIYIYGGYLVINGKFTIGSILAFQKYSIMFVGPCMSIIHANNYLQKTKVSIDRIYSVLDKEFENERCKFGEVIQPNKINAIRLKDVCFSYNNEEICCSTNMDKNSNLIDHLFMTFERGKVTAIVGQSGCGKSTIINLLYRLWDVNKGEILINDTPIKEINIMSLRKNISIVSQDTIIFDGSIKDNITMMNSVSDEKVIELCSLVGLSDFVDSLELGINTELGERGSRISGGQRQRISIAREILRDSPILILDEATSALDNISQINIFENLKEYTNDKIVIVITHRLSTVIDSDKIYVMENGKVVEEGTHRNLIELDGVYKSYLSDNIDK